MSDASVFYFFPASRPPPAIRRRNNGLQDTAMPEAIVPYAVSGLDDRDILARNVEAPDAPLASVRREIWAVDSNMAVTETGVLKTLLSHWRR